VDVYREAQLLDEKRIDFLARYGFAGPIGIEVKLASNKDMQSKDLRKSKSFESMCTYMEGYNASHGIFLVIDDAGGKNLDKIKATFEQISHVWVKSFLSGRIVIPSKKATAKAPPSKGASFSKRVSAKQRKSAVKSNAKKAGKK
jgi:hypothetical protein